MSKIYKVNYLNNTAIETIFVFYGKNYNDINLTELFSTDSENIIFNDIFNKEELDIISNTSINVIFVSNQIHLDDTIDIVKRKIIMELKQNNLEIGFEELYLFGLQTKSLNSIKIYQELTQNDQLELTKTRLSQFVLNVNSIDISKIKNYK